MLSGMRRALRWMLCSLSGVALALVVAACGGGPGRFGAEPVGRASEPGAGCDAGGQTVWTEGDRAVLQSLSLASLPPTPDDPSNRYADDPTAAELGHLLFFDPGLSANGRVSCATCHEPERFFTDGRRVSVGVGRTDRNAPTVVGAAHAPWLFADGRRDSLWAQALAPLESAAEMGSTRMEVVRRAATHPTTRALFARAFGRPPPFEDRTRFPERAGPFGDREARAAWARMRASDRAGVDRAFANVGKAIAAYERLLRPGQTRFDRYVSSLPVEPCAGGAEASPTGASLTETELRGLRLFLDEERTLCLRCHNGPLLTNQSFHHVATDVGAGGQTEFGRFLGIQAVLVDPFNCLGPFSDADASDCAALRFLNRDHVAAETGKFRTPTLRGLPQTAPYMHDGRFATLEEVIEHYRDPPMAQGRPHELLPLDLDREETEALVAFLQTLDGAVAAGTDWLSPPGEQDAQP